MFVNATESYLLVCFIAAVIYGNVIREVADILRGSLRVYFQHRMRLSDRHSLAHSVMNDHHFDLARRAQTFHQIRTFYDSILDTDNKTTSCWFDLMTWTFSLSSV